MCCRYRCAWAGQAFCGCRIRRGVWCTVKGCRRGRICLRDWRSRMREMRVSGGRWATCAGAVAVCGRDGRPAVGVWRFALRALRTGPLKPSRPGRTQLIRGNGSTTSWLCDSTSRVSSLTRDLASTGDDLTLEFTYSTMSQIAQGRCPTTLTPISPCPKSTGRSRRAQPIFERGGTTHTDDGRDSLKTVGFGLLWWGQAGSGLTGVGLVWVCTRVSHGV